MSVTRVRNQRVLAILEQSKKIQGSLKKKRVKFWSTAYKVRVHHFVIFASEFELVVFQKLGIILKIASAKWTKQTHDTATVVLQSRGYPCLPARSASWVFAWCFQHVWRIHHAQMTKLVLLWCHFNRFRLLGRGLTATWKKVKWRTAVAWINRLVRSWILWEFRTLW
jgi:hypothetical protein